MQAEIKNEVSDGFGLLVTDNNHVEHKIGVCYDGEIDAHLQNGYPDDPKKRTDEGNEHVRQARRFARYHVYRERGYSTLPSHENPDRIATVALLLSQLTSDQFENYFGDYYRQLRSHETDTEPVVSVPSAVEPRDYLFYQQEIHLGAVVDQLTGLSPESTEEMPESFLNAAVEMVVTSTETDPEALATELLALADENGLDPDERGWLADLGIESVSDIHIHWLDWNGEEHTVRNGSQDDDPDTRLELRPYTPESLESFRQDLIRHLGCQIRDCYLGLGIAPPEAVRLQGPGMYDYYVRYLKLDGMYEPYHDTTTEITDWQESTTPTIR